MQYAHYDQRNKKLGVERVKVQNKRVINYSRIEVNISKIGSIGLIKLHQNIGEALGHSIKEQEDKNVRLKRRLN